MNDDPDRQIPFLSIGFRPFFLAAGLYAVIAMFAWTVWLMLHDANAVILYPTIAVPAHLWHGHEMLFGYTGAVITGFMLTAVPGWTGARRVAGTPLLLLLAAWFAGRIAMWLSSFLPGIVVAAADMAFLPMLAVTIGGALVRQFQPRNAIFLLLIVFLIVANGAIHAEWLGWADSTASWALAVAILDVALLITILGGRIVPSFTRNAMVRRGVREGFPAQMKPVELVSIAGVAGVLVCQLAVLPDGLTATVAVIAALSNVARQSLWRPFSAIAEPILWSLHLAYLWIPIGLLALAGHLAFGLISWSASLHVIAVGAIGGMTMAMITRAPLGHTGRPLIVHRTIVLAYVMIALATFLRGFALDLWPHAYFQIVLIAGLLWMSSFGIFISIYLPILVGPSLKEQAND